MLRESWTVLRESIGDLRSVVSREINPPACVDTIVRDGLAWYSDLK